MTLLAVVLLSFMVFAIVRLSFTLRQWCFALTFILPPKWRFAVLNRGISESKLDTLNILQHYLGERRALNFLLEVMEWSEERVFQYVSGLTTPAFARSVLRPIDP